MSKIPSPHFPTEIWAIVFSISSLINFEIVYIWPIWAKVWTRGFGLQFFFLFLFFFFHPQQSCTLFEILNIESFYFLLNYDLFCPNRSYQGQKYRNVAMLWKGVSAPFPFSSLILDITLSLETCNPPVLLTPPISRKYQIL